MDLKNWAVEPERGELYEVVDPTYGLNHGCI